MNPQVSICITTRNRRQDLARTLREIARLEPPPAELILVADGCTDGTCEFVRTEFPAARLIVHEPARGSIPSRNEMAAICNSDVFLSLDDDSHPMERDALARIAHLFKSNPGLAVAAFPQRTDETPATLTQADFGPARHVGYYANSAAALRSSVFAALGGYVDFFGHAYEEPDFALRCVAAGWQVRLEPAVTVRHHYTAAQRSELRMHQQHSRNELWSVLLRCPAPQVFAIAVFRLARQAGYARGRGWLRREPQWWRACLAGLPRCLAQRQPLAWKKYRAWMQLVRQPIADDAEWRAKFGTPRA